MTAESGSWDADGSGVRRWLEDLPKLELHLHLEGAIPLEALWNLIQKYGGSPEVPDRAALRQRFIYRDFPHFLETWLWKNQFLREYQDFTFIAAAVARDLARQNYRYAEVFYSPPEYATRGLTIQGITEAIRAGLAQVPQVEVALIADLVRNFGPERAMVTLAQVDEVRDAGVIGIGLGGAEHDFPPELFSGVYDRARALGFHLTAHAGEAAGADSVWGALRALGVERVGHGTRALEDPALVAHLVARQIPLEVCPLSNVCTGVVPDLASHPIRHYVEQGVCVTVNTDDPQMFGNSLLDELWGLVRVHGFSRAEIGRLLLNAVAASWLPPERRAALREEIAQAVSSTREGNDGDVC